MSFFDGIETFLNSTTFCKKCGKDFDSPIQLWEHLMSWCKGKPKKKEAVKILDYHERRFGGKYD